MNNLITSDAMDELKQIVGNIPQSEFPTEHYFSNGMYCRKLVMGPNSLIIGKKHKEDHLLMCVKGSLKIAFDDKSFIMNEGDVIESKKGDQRAIYTDLGGILVTVHKTDKTDLDEIEKDLIESEEISMFDSSNNLKKDLLE